ncbi:hypothetical protein FTUN_4973 [Frigoriglobus tundricola]|uniref:Uncharacterized protein n=1 Tax=Frigoriglobus tundricola TaxID=2774151 RepID=A0A6M5YU32_9BACT|nr:hypothetical protein FTUN_4973 [Frigoriglobus tundricola]
MKALQAQGVGRAEAEERAAAVAAALVDGAAEARKARKAGKQADLRGMVRAARTGKPRPGYNVAGKRLRDLWLRDLLNDWFGRRLRFGLGALLLAAGLQWMFQNQLLTDKNPIVEQVRSGQVVLAVTTLSEPTGKPLGVAGLPAKPTDVVDSYRAPIAGACLLFSAVFVFGWRASVPAVAGAVVAVAGPALGAPDTGVMSPGMLSLGAGTLLILVGGWLLRK